MRASTSSPGSRAKRPAGGRNAITDFEEVVGMESEYIRRLSVAEGLRILFRTVPVVARGAVRALTRASSSRGFLSNALFLLILALHSTRG